MLYAVELYSSGWWESYAATFEIAWVAACAPTVWRARDEWLALFSFRRIEGEHVLLVGVGLCLLGFFLIEYFWFARTLRVTLLTWPVAFSVKGLPPAAIVALLVAFRPIVEELFFRGFVQIRLERVMTPGRALIAQAMLFAAARGVDGAVVSYLLLGLTLGWVRHRARNLYAPLALHVIYAAWVTLAGLGYLSGPFALELYY
jgi:membrane protease YdiL (CAAX protease family)